MGYKVNIGQMYKAEIDFVAEKTDSVAYVQVTYLLASEETVEREFGNLKLIKDGSPDKVRGGLPKIPTRLEGLSFKFTTFAIWNLKQT